MRRTTRTAAGLLAVALAAAPLAVNAQELTPPDVTVTQEEPPRPSPEKPFDYYPIVVGLGAVAGVVGFNLVVLGVEALPGGMAYASGATVPAEMSVAMSRVYATTAAVIGGVAAYYLYAP